MLVSLSSIQGLSFKASRIIIRAWRFGSETACDVSVILKGFELRFNKAIIALTSEKSIFTIIRGLLSST